MKSLKVFESKFKSLLILLKSSPYMNSQSTAGLSYSLLHLPITGKHFHFNS